MAALGPVIALLGGFVFAADRGGSSDDAAAAPKEIFLEPSASVGPDPFSHSVARPAPSSTIPPVTVTPLGAPPTTTTNPSAATSTEAAGTTAVPAVQGTAPGLYGGTRNESSCDVPALVAFLQANPDEASAWAQAQGIQPGDVSAYIERLTPVLLQADTRVTNHGFRNGSPTPRQSVLQAGSAVLVDDTGVPRARCSCGNPLVPPRAAEQRFVGDAWPGFDPAAVQVVGQGPSTETLVLRDVGDGTAIARPVGTTGEADTETTVPPGTLPPTTTEPLTSAPATTSTTSTAPAAENVVRSGSATASSVHSDDYPASLAIDGDPTTSWFSQGDAEGPSSLFIWVAPDEMTFGRVRIVGNRAHPEFPTGFGFDSVEVRVLDAAGDEVFMTSVALPGTPDPDVDVTPNVRGNRLVLTFNGREAPDCGGFAELEVYAG